VPLVIAAGRAATSRTKAQVTTDATAAITVADNEAASRLWDRLGGGTAAADAMDQVLRDGGDDATDVQAVKTRSEFTAFGQTEWTLRDQAGFAARLGSVSGSDTVLGLMGRISSGQRWGLGQLPSAYFKGGWGPDDGGYTVRQFGLISVSDAGGRGCVAVAIGVHAPGFAAGTAALDRLAATLKPELKALPEGPCPF
jgi:hypothetical protein